MSKLPSRQWTAANLAVLPESLITIFDLDGTITRSLDRRHACYAKAIKELQKPWRVTMKRLFGTNWLNDKPEMELKPLSREDFGLQYPQSEDISDLLPCLTRKGRKESIVGEEVLCTLFSLRFQSILQEYHPEDLALDVVPPDNIKALKSIISVTSGSVVSFRCHEKRTALEQLRAMGLINGGDVCDVFEEPDINIVGQKGASSRKIKLEFIRTWYHQIIEGQIAIGGLPILIGDSLADMEVALALDMGFLGTTETGETCRDKFERAIRLKEAAQTEKLNVWLYRSLADPALLEKVTGLANDYQTKLVEARESLAA